MVVKKNPSRLKKLENEGKKGKEPASSGDKDYDITKILDEEENKPDNSEPELEPATVEEAHVKKLKIQETKDISLLRRLAADARKDASDNMAKYTKINAKAEKLIASAEKEKEKAEALMEKAEALKEKADMDREMAKIEEGSKAAKLKARAEKTEAKRRAILAKADRHRAKSESLREKAMKYKEEAAEYYEKAKIFERTEREYTLRADRLEGKSSEHLSSAKSAGAVKTKKRL